MDKLTEPFQNKLKERVKGSTLIESLVALVIVMLCFSGATTLFVQVSESSNNQQRAIARALMDESINEIIDLESNVDAEIVVKGLTLIQKFEKYEDKEHLILCFTQVKGKEGKVLAERRDLILKQ